MIKIIGQLVNTLRTYMESGFRGTATRRPGRLLEQIIEKMSSYLFSLQGVVDNSEIKRMQPVVGAYLQSVLIPSRRGQISLRNLQELKTLATVLDLFLLGRGTLRR